VAQALAAIEKKKLVLAQIDSWASDLAHKVCPAPIREQLYKILFKPDKNSPEYKAVVEASRATQTAPLDLLQQAGAIESAYDFHWQRFLFDNFPKGTSFPAISKVG
jgi:exoribonuclease-2